MPTIIDLPPGEFEVIGIDYATELPPPPNPFAQFSQAINEVALAMYKTAETVRRLIRETSYFHNIDPPPREPHHMHLIKRHIRKPRKPRK